MANNSVITLEKPLQHLSLDDWNARLTQLRTVADTRRNDAFELRHSARSLRNETKIQTDWDTYQNNALIEERVGELTRWRITIETALDRIEREMRSLREEKATTERELESMVTGLLVVSECLTMRDNRLGAELTYDEGDTELKKELCVVENNQRLLRDQCQAAWEKLNRLEEVRFRLSLEITNKKEAELIDAAQIDVNRYSANTSLKPFATREPKNSIPYEGWLEHTKAIKELADNELADTYAIRESLFVCREKARNILRAQQDRTEHILRKRIFETQRARNELEYQKEKMKEEMEKCLAEIKSLEEALQDKLDCLKLAESRLESRAQRSGKELVRDDPYDGLKKEVFHIRKSQQTLQDKIDCTKTVYNALLEHALKIDVDLTNKQHSLMTDIRALDLRARLKTDDCKTVGDIQTQRNITLTKMEDEIPPT